jgi:Protein of unknown function (DUF3363)
VLLRLLSRGAELERLGLAEQVVLGRRYLRPGIEQTLRELGIRGAIIKTIHRAMTGVSRDPDVLGCALHGENPTGPMLDRLVARVSRKARPMCNAPTDDRFG